jgi:hypothetical protein
MTRVSSPPPGFLVADLRVIEDWASGTPGEQVLANSLAKWVGHQAVVLPADALTKTPSNAEHIIVAPSGVWVVATRNYRGLACDRSIGRRLIPDIRIYVGDLDCTDLTGSRGIGHAVRVVKALLGDEDIPVYGALCFTDAEWGMFPVAIEHNGVLVTWPIDLAVCIAKAGQATDGDVLRVSSLLSAALAPGQK